jgi:hypothetical protein
MTKVLVILVTIYLSIITLNANDLESLIKTLVDWELKNKTLSFLIYRKCASVAKKNIGLK